MFFDEDTKLLVTLNQPKTKKFKGSGPKIYIENNMSALKFYKKKKNSYVNNNIKK